MTFTDDFQRLHGFYHIESRARWIKVTIAEGINLDLLKKYQPEMQAAIASMVVAGGCTCGFRGMLC